MQYLNSAAAHLFDELLDYCRGISSLLNCIQTTIVNTFLPLPQLCQAAPENLGTYQMMTAGVGLSDSSK